MRSSLLRPSDRELIVLPAFASTVLPKRGMELVDLRSLGILPGIGGGSRGFNTEGDVITQTADGRDLNAMWQEFQATIQLQNAERDRIVQFLTFPVTQLIEDVSQVVGDDFEEASEFGEPKSIRAVGSYFSMAYDFRWFDLAARYTWKFLAEATATQVEAINNAALEAHSRLVFARVMKTIFNPTNLNADINGQNYNVYKFYNADGVVPPTYRGNTFAGTHTHYYTTGAATVDPGDLEDLIDKLGEHGYTIQNGYRIVIMVNKQEGKPIRLFRAGVGGATWDFLVARGEQPVIMPTDTILLNGAQPANSLDGLHVIGSYADALIVEDDYVPAGYMLAFATGGPEALTNPVGFREHANPALRGLRLVKGPNPNYPLVDSFYNVGFGTGIRQRGGGAVVQVTTSGTYTTPTLYQ